MCDLRGVRGLDMWRDHNPDVARGGALLSLVDVILTYFEQMKNEQVP